MIVKKSSFLYIINYSFTILHYVLRYLHVNSVKYAYRCVIGIIKKKPCMNYARLWFLLFSGVLCPVRI